MIGAWARATNPVASRACSTRRVDRSSANRRRRERTRRVLSKRQILDHVWQYDFGGDANIVETYVSYLRRKLDRHGPPLIHTVRLVGYVLREG